MNLWQALTAPFRRKAKRPLADRAPSRDEMGQAGRSVPLGMEATDIDLVERVARQNDRLERVNGVRMFTKSLLRERSTFVAPLPDDETYAARFHRVFNKKGT